MGPRLCLLAVLGCESTERLHIDFAAGDRSEVLFVEHGEELAAYAVSLEDGLDVPTIFAASDRPRLHALLFPHALDELGLEPGLIDREVQSDFPGRLAAIPSRYFVREVTRDDPGSWIPSSTISAPDLLLRRMIDAPDPSSCLARGGCFAHDARDARVCLSECPEPREPAPPAEPAPPDIECPPGWQEVTSELGAWCEPWSAGSPACAEGQARFPGEGVCVALGSCSADGWAATIPPAKLTLFVDPAAPPGQDGSTRDLALPTIEEALARAIEDTVVVLRSGSHLLDGTIDGKVALIGCAATIDALAEVTGEVEIRSATIDGMLAVTGTGSLVLREAVVRAAIDVSAFARLERVRLLGAMELDGVLVAHSLEVRGAFDSRGIATLEDVAVSSAFPFESRGALTLSRALIEGSWLALEGEADLSHVLIRGASRAIVAARVDLELRSVRLAGAVELAGGTASFVDAILSTSDMTALLCRGCEVRLSRTLVEGLSPMAHGIEIDQTPNARITLDDVRLKGSGSIGIHTADEAAPTRRLELTRVRIEDTSAALRLLGIEVQLTDVMLARTAVGADVGTTGSSLPEVRATRLEIAGGGSCRYGMLAAVGARLDLDAVAVRGCQQGVLAAPGGTLVMHGFRLEENDTGLRLFRNVDDLAIPYEVDLIDGLIGDNGCGVTHTPVAEPYDFKRVATRVRFADNGKNMEAVAAGTDGNGCPR
jgi:hypothetical protein